MSLEPAEFGRLQRLVEGLDPSAVEVRSVSRDNCFSHTLETARGRVELNTVQHSEDAVSGSVRGLITGLSRLIRRDFPNGA